MINWLERWLQVVSYSVQDPALELKCVQDLIECGPYVTGANFSGFKALMPLVDLSFPIAEIASDGAVAITRCRGYGGAVTRVNTIAQLLYEIQGELYLNSDVVADLSNVAISQAGPDRVDVSGIKGLPPPATTKAMIAAKAGYEAQAIFYINGLDIQAKVDMMKQQLAHVFRDHRFSKLSIEVSGSAPENPQSQAEGTVSLRVFAQARKIEDIAANKFKIPIYALRMQSYPGRSRAQRSRGLNAADLYRVSHEPGLPYHGSKAIHGDLSRSISSLQDSASRANPRSSDRYTAKHCDRRVWKATIIRDCSSRTARADHQTCSRDHRSRSIRRQGRQLEHWILCSSCGRVSLAAELHDDCETTRIIRQGLETRMPGRAL